MGPLTRRTAMTGGSLAAAAGASAALRGSGDKPFFQRTGLPIGVQLYTLGDTLASQLDATLAQLAQIGFKTVELAGFLGRSPAQLREAFTRAGLTCPSAHVAGRPFGPDPSLSGDLGAVIDAAHTLGLTYVVMPIFYIPERFVLKPEPGEDFAALLGRIGGQMTEDDWKYNADFLNQKGAVLKRAGLKLGYHNHNVEFAPKGAACGYDLLLQGTDPDLVCFEMDVGWVTAAGHDPLALLRDHPGRFRLMHVKDVKPDTQTNFALRQDPTEVGAGKIDWKAILPAAQAAGVSQFFIEQEPPFAGPRIDAVHKSFDYLSALVA